MDPEASAEEPAARGKLRTWWHPLLVNMLRWQLGNHYRVEEEVPVGQKPLQIDILLLRKEGGELSARARAILAGLVERLGLLTLIEFKSPSDSLSRGDLPKFLAYALLYRAQNEDAPDPAQMHLVVLAPRLTRPYRDEIKALAMTAVEEEPGVWRIQGCPFPLWVLETVTLTGLNHPLVTLVSPQMMRTPGPVYDSLCEAGYNEMAAYMAQQVAHFSKLGKEFAMQHTGISDMNEVMAEIIKEMPLEVRLKGLTTEERLKGLPAEERLKGLPAEERLKGLPAEERLKGLSAEERLHGLPPEERARLRKLLQDESSGSMDGGQDK